MRKIAAAFLMSVVTISGASLAFADDDEAKVAEISEQSPNIVQLWAFGQGGGGTGSAAIIEYDKNRYYLTNAHVVKDALRIWVDKDGTKEEVRIIGLDPDVDLALVSEATITKDIPAVTFGDSELLKVGERVYALGYPFLTRATTAGNISALTVAYSPLFIQSTAPLNPGNSGGPLFNKRHEMVAMNTAIGKGANLIGYSVPVKNIQRLLPRLLKSRLVKHADIPGVTLQDTKMLVPFFFEQNGIPYPPAQHGPMVVDVEQQAQGSFQVGDVVTKIDGYQVPSMRDFELKLFFDYQPNNEATLTVLRSGAERDVKVTLREVRPPEIRIPVK